MVTVADVLAVLDGLAPEARAASWDPVGLQIGDADAPVATAAVCHEVTPEIVERLVAEPVDLVVAYHPLLFRPAVRFVAGPGPTGRAFRLASAGIALAVAHTNFDVAPGGAADALAAALHLGEVRGFGPLWGADSARIVTFAPSEAVEDVAAAMAAAGGGRHGAYAGCSFRTTGIGAFTAAADARPAIGSAGSVNREDEVRIEMASPSGAVDEVVAALVAAHPYEEPVYDVIGRRGESGFVGRVGVPEGIEDVDALAEVVSVELGGVVRVAGSGAVGSVAVVPGSGADFIGAARRAGADAIVTGDVRHHAAREAVESGLAVVDPGHIATERPGVRRLYAAVSRAVPAVMDLTDDPDPWRPA